MSDRAPDERALFDGLPLGQIVRVGRAFIEKAEGDTWLAPGESEVLARTDDIVGASAGQVTILSTPEQVREREAAARRDERREWADWIASGLSAAGLPEPFTADTVLEWMSREDGRKPFGVMSNDAGGRPFRDDAAGGGNERAV